MRILILLIVLFSCATSYGEDYIRKEESALSYTPILDDRYLKLDQTTSQSIINGIPSMTSSVDISGSSYQVVNKEYVDTAILSLTLVEFFSAVDSVVSDGLGGYYKIMDNSQQASGTNTSPSAGTLGAGNDQYIRGYITPVGMPNLTTLYAGTYSVRGNLYKTGTKDVRVYKKLFYRNLAGTETLIATSDTSGLLSLVSTPYNLNMYVSSNVTLLSSDRLVLRIYANVGSSGSNVTISGSVGGTTSSGLTIMAPAIDISSLSTAISFSCIAGEALKKGQAVYISGASSGIPQVSLADNTSSLKCRVVGSVTEDLASGAIGRVRRAGVLVSVDTTAATGHSVNPNDEVWAAGTLLFATTNGGMTKTRPTSGRSVKTAFTLLGNSTLDTLLIYPFENPVWHTAASGENNVLRVGDDIGVNKTSFRNYSNTEVASVNSYGLTTSKELRIIGDGSITRDANNFIQTVVLGSRTLTVTRNASNFITSVTDGLYTWTYTRDGNGRITSWAVT